jgi:hypothetical protein
VDLNPQQSFSDNPMGLGPRGPESTEKLRRASLFGLNPDMVREETFERR